MAVHWLGDAFSSVLQRELAEEKGFFIEGDSDKL